MSPMLNPINLLQIILLLGLISCQPANKNGDGQENSDQTKKITEQLPNESDYTVLTYDRGHNWIFENAKPTDLSLEELTKIETTIHEALQANNETQQRQLEDHNKKFPDNPWSETGYELTLDNNKRQYLPVIVNGHKEVYVNFFCNDYTNEGWRDQLVAVDDGGNCFFNLKINLATLTYYELMINGYA